MRFLWGCKKLFWHAAKKKFGLSYIFVCAHNTTGPGMGGGACGEAVEENIQIYEYVVAAKYNIVFAHNSMRLPLSARCPYISLSRVHFGRRSLIKSAPLHYYMPPPSPLTPLLQIPTTKFADTDSDFGARLRTSFFFSLLSAGFEFSLELWKGRGDHKHTHTEQIGRYRYRRWAGYRIAE